jgi:tight adherence protein C
MGVANEDRAAMKVAIIKERRANERRVAASPDSVKHMVGMNLQVVVESGAGAEACFPDDAYSAAGATIVGDAAAALTDADIVLKVQRPLLGGAVFFALRAATQGRLQVEAVLGRMSGYGYAPAPSGSDPRAWLRKVGYVAPGGRGEAAEVLRRKLAAAGWSKHLVPEDVAGLKIVLPAAAYGGMFVAAAFDVIPVLVAAVTGLALSALAYVGLPAVIDMRMRGRRDKIVSGLPTVLDLLTLSIEAGMSFDAAVGRLVRRLDGPLIDELAFMQREMQLGTGRSDALTALALRVDAAEVTSFARALAQAEKLGVPLAHMLRTQADELRIRLRNDAEEQAMRAPVKMLFPTVALIFPAVFIVVLGPAVISLLDNLGRVR